MEDQKDPPKEKECGIRVFAHVDVYIFTYVYQRRKSRAAEAVALKKGIKDARDSR